MIFTMFICIKFTGAFANLEVNLNDEVKKD